MEDAATNKWFKERVFLQAKLGEVRAAVARLCVVLLAKRLDDPVLLGEAFAEKQRKVGPAASASRAPH